MSTSRLEQLLARIDSENKQDPSLDSFEGLQQPKEFVYSLRLTRWVLRLCPKPSEILQIAARGQHIRRWTIPRENYPRNRQGYLRWREMLKAFHARTVGELMRQTSYSPEEIKQVESLVLKKRPMQDAEQAALEDALCLLFLETQLEDVRTKVSEETMRQVLRKTWAKMSARGREEALKLPLTEAQRQWIQSTLGS